MCLFYIKVEHLHGLLRVRTDFEGIKQALVAMADTNNALTEQ